MPATIKTIVEYEEGGVRWAHELAPGSTVQHLNVLKEGVGRVIGPTHNPYWLLLDGTTSKKEPKR